MNVYRCCVYSYNKKGLLGSLKDKTFRKLWEEESLQKDLQNFNATSCVRCMFNDKNKSIQSSLLSEKRVDNNLPNHINFI